MADKVIVSREKLVAVADAVREKTGGSESLTLDEMPGAIAGIESGGGDINALVDGTITEYRSALTSIRSYAFQGCTRLVLVEMPTLLSIPSYAFNNCASLPDVSFPAVQNIGERAFYSCDKIATIDLPELVELGARVFQDCFAVENVNVPKLQSVGTYSFASNRKLEKIDLPSCTSLGTYAFYGSYILTAVILRSPILCAAGATNIFQNCYHYHGTKHATYNPEGLKDGYIYVPAALVEQYKAATNWTTYASQIRAIEDYPEITGG